jgi:hypothetical protein
MRTELPNGSDEPKKGGVMRMLRFRVGRALMHLGLNILPPGRVNDELTEILNEWGRKVLRTVKENGKSL